MATSSSEDKKRVSIIVRSLHDPAYAALVANHIVKEEKYVAAEEGKSLVRPVGISKDIEVVYKGNTYSFTVARDRRNSLSVQELIAEVSRRVEYVNCIAFVLDKETIDDEESFKELELFDGYDSLQAQSISLLIITGCGRETSDKEKEGVIKRCSEKIRYQPVKGIIPVCFSNDDFRLSGPMKGIRQRMIDKDRDLLCDVICCQSDSLVPVKELR